MENKIRIPGIAGEFNIDVNFAFMDWLFELPEEKKRIAVAMLVANIDSPTVSRIYNIIENHYDQIQDIKKEMDNDGINS